MTDELKQLKPYDVEFIHDKDKKTNVPNGKELSKKLKKIKKLKTYEF